MQRKKLDHLKAEVASASAAEILELDQVIQKIIAQQCVEMALARRARTVSETRLCPHCAGNNAVCHGKDQNGRQRFKCRSCKRTYNILTGTPMARARKPEKWLHYLNFMTQHTSVRAIHKAGIGLNHVTIWRWRHRFLKAAANANAALLVGVIEADTMFLRRSLKGCRSRNKVRHPKSHTARSLVERAVKKRSPSDQVSVLTALDSSGSIVQSILTSVSTIETVLEGRIAAGSVLCSDGCAVYAKVADRAQAEPWVISIAPSTPNVVKESPIGRPRRIRIHLGLRRVHDYHRQFKHLVNVRCCGVATKYLENYLGWHRAMLCPGFEGKVLLTLAL